MSTAEIKAAVPEKYAQAAWTRTTRSSCCGPTAACGTADPISSDLYDASEREVVPEQALRASLGCGNPMALAELKPGETILDLGLAEAPRCPDKIFAHALTARGRGTRSSPEVVGRKRCWKESDSNKAVGEGRR